MLGSRRRRSGPDPLWLYGIPALLAVTFGGAIAYFALVYLPGERARTVTEAEHGLTARAEVQTIAIERCLEDGLKDVGTIASYPSVEALIRATMTPGGGGARGQAGTEAHLDTVLGTFARIQGYENCLVFDSRLVPMTWCAGLPGPERADSAAAREVLAGRAAVVRVDLYERGYPEVVFALPVLVRRAGRPGTGGGA